MPDKLKKKEKEAPYMELARWIKPAAFVIGGAAIGYVYYRFIGCKGG